MDQENKNNKNNEIIDLSDALKDYNVDENLNKGYGTERLYYPKEASKMVQWVIKHSGGLIKEEKQANYVLIGFAVVVIIVALFLFFGRGEKQNTPPVEQYINRQQFLPE